jgi:hypothetical protein
MFNRITRFLRGSPVSDRGPSLPLELARRGWKPHGFKGSPVVVLLPERFVVAATPEGVLQATVGGEQVEFSATLHDFQEHRSASLDFVTYLAGKKNLRTRDKGTYRFYYDPADAPPSAVSHRFWVVGIPGAVVVISLLGTRDAAATDALKEVWDAVPDLVGEMF